MYECDMSRVECDKDVAVEGNELKPEHRCRTGN